MKVTLTHEEVLEACQEWLRKHYGIQAGNDVNIFANIVVRGEQTSHRASRIAIEFADAPKPQGGPYRTPAENS